MAETAKRILIVRLSAIGDVLRVLPAMQVLKKNYPESHIGWVVEAGAKDILEAHPDIDEVFVFPKREIVQQLRSGRNLWAGIVQFRAFMQRIRVKRYDLVIDFHGLFKSGIISYLSGAPERVGFARGFCREFNFLFTNRHVELEKKRLNRVDRNLLLLQGLGLDVAHRPPVLHVPEDDQRIVRRFFTEQGFDPGRPIIAVHPGTSSTTPYKRWDPYRYAVVADQIIEAHAVQVVFTWAGAERGMVDEITGLMKHRAVVAPETENLCQLAEIFLNCDLYLGSDTGPMHLAAFAGIPVVAVFGPTDVVVNEPYAQTPHIIIRKETACSPCRKYDCRKRTCMKEISAESVVRGVNMMLDSIKQR